MRHLITTVAVLLFSLASAQETPKTFNLDQKLPKTKEQVINKSEKTTHKAVWKGQTYEVYQTKKGSLFIVIENKEKTGYTKKTIKPELYAQN